MYVLGIDLGTSSLKGVLINRAGLVLASSQYEYASTTPSFGFSEQNSSDWIKAFNHVIQNFIDTVEDFHEGLEGISVSGQMHSLVLLDENKNVLRPAILWNDVRTSKQCQEITDRLGQRLLEITKNIALEGFTLPKILWLQENEPEVWSRVKKIMLPKDYLSLWLTGNIYTEFSDAAGTLLLDIEKKQWSED